MAENKPGLMMTIVRWGARVVGTLMVLLLAFFFVAEGVMAGVPMPILTAEEFLEMIVTLVMLVGVIASWRWEALGGWLCLVGGVFFNIVESFGEGYVRIVWFPVVFALVGVGFILCHRAAPIRPSHQLAGQ